MWYSTYMSNETKILNPGYIYTIVRNSDGKIYVGQTRQDPSKRSRVKGDNFTHGYGISKVGKALSAYGWTEFTHTVIESIAAISDGDLDQLEARYIAEYNALDRNKGFNTKSFQEGGQQYYTSEVKERMSLAKKGKAVSGPAWNASEMFLINEVTHWKCSSCEAIKPESSFSKNPRTKVNGVERTRPVVHKCKTCAAEYKRKHYPYKRTIQTKEQLEGSYQARKQAMSEGAKRAHAKDPTLKTRAAKARSKAIVAKDPITGQIVHTFSSGLEAKTAGFNNVTVSEAIKKGIVRLGFKWELA